MAKRVLVIAYYFPPSGGSGVQRALKFVKYLPSFGWMPEVLTLDPASAAYPDLDPDMLREVPDGVNVHRTGAWDPYRIYAGFTNKSKADAVSVGFLSDKPISYRERIARWVRANVFIPDARVGWYFYALKKARTLVASGEIDAIFTTGPPHSTHLIGRSLKRRYNVPWIADFRDPWVDIDFLEELPMTGFARRKNARLEKSVLDESDAVLTVSPVIERQFVKKTNTPCVTIYNGFDRDDFSSDASLDPDTFYISHVGNMNAARNPVALWQALAQVKEQVPKLKIRLVGNVDGAVMQALEAAGLLDLVERIAYCPHGEAVRYMKQSAALLLPINRVFSAKGIVTGKLFEYLATGNPVLGIGPPDGDAAAILQDTGAGKMIDFDNGDAMLAYVRSLYTQWDAGKQHPHGDTSAIARYSRSGLTGQLAAMLDDIVGEKRT
ncbi:MAG: glycosyltransferase [Bacteroidota bacterium]